MDLFNLRAALTLDSSEYEEQLSKVSNASESEASKMSSKWGKAGKLVAGAMAAMSAAAGAAVLKIGKDALTAYADYQQLEGGVQKLYGNMGLSAEEYAKTVGKSVSEVNAEWQRNEKAQELVMANARQAFRTTGLSANQYMEQATSFSAALINSLGGDTVEAAKQTDVAMRAIADNYNTFGGDMQNIQYAFQGFAKQNYTMLDNLKLGYGGTKTEMERLIADANKWAEENGKAADLSIDSFSDVVTAIDYIQQKQNIAGTTSREAASTISGSIGMVKAAYENLISGLANPDADISQLVKDLTSSVGTAAGNIIPAMEQFAKGFGDALSELAPSIINGIPNMISTALPILVESATQLVGVLIQTMQTALPQLIDVGKGLLESLAEGVEANAGDFIESGMNLLLQFSDFIRNSAGQLIPLGLKVIKSLADGIIQNIPTFIETVPQIISNFANVINENAPKILEVGFSIITGLIGGLIKAIPTLIANIPQIIQAIVDVFMAFQWLNLGKIAITGIANGIKAFGNLLKNSAKEGVSGFGKSIASGFKAAKDKAVSYMKSLKDGVVKRIQEAKDKVKGIIDKIKGFFPFKVGKLFSGLKLPHFSVKGSAPFGLGGKGTKPSISVNWYKKAYDTPYLFDRPTVISGMGFGDGVGDEMVYGKSSLMSDITEAMQAGGGKTVNITNHITVNGAEDPEAYMQKFVRSMEIQMRTA